MVCTFGSGKMACIARFLDVGNLEEKSSEEATNERTAFQTIYKQLCDADEPNLLEEKDVVVFDSRPLTDPLHLVCCNACKKPVKASHIAAHAELCRSINFKEDDALELDAGTDRKVPPRRGRKKNQATNELCRSINFKEDDALELDAGTDRKVPPRRGRKKNQATNGREVQKPELACRDNVASMELNLENQNGMLHSASGEARRMAVSDDHGTRTVASTVCHKGTNYSDMPDPLATKIYYSQGSHRLRTALGHLYRQSSAKEHVNGSTFAEMNQDKTMLSSREQNAKKL